MKPTIKIVRSPEYYSFVCKRGQHDQVADILRELGMQPSMMQDTFIQGCWNSDGTLVYAQLLEGQSKRSIDKEMYRRGVPGARNG